jgi:hypothetical protein
VAGDVMLPVVVWLHAFKDLRMDILEAMRADTSILHHYFVS